MAYKVIILYQLYMPSYFLGTFTEYPYDKQPQLCQRLPPLSKRAGPILQQGLQKFAGSSSKSSMDKSVCNPNLEKEAGSLYFYLVKRFKKLS
ncbi:hypothetical protein, partial [Odoribacter splanchnicus]